MGQTMDIETFGNIIDEFLEKSHVQMLLDMPEGTQHVTIKDNTQMGPVVQFYILLKALPAVYRGFSELIDGTKEEAFIDTTLELVKKEILKEE